MPEPLRAPFPWFGGKAAVADQVWRALGAVNHYVEPFFGSGAVLLARPDEPGTETVNDADGLLANFWRAVRADPEAVADAADWPVNEADLHARHLWLVGQRDRITERLMADAGWCDVQAAGWWVWGLCSWIGGGWCSGQGPWRAVDGVLTHLGSAGQGIKRKLPHLGDAGRGINRKLPHLGDAGQGINRQRAAIHSWFAALSERLCNVRVACGDWSRVTGPSVLRAAGGVTGVFLDPPYDRAMRAGSIYAHESDAAKECTEWARRNGDSANLRIVLAGYAGEHDDLEAMGWRVAAWKARGGYGSQGDARGRKNAGLERLWFSPACLDDVPQRGLFDAHQEATP